MPSFYEGLFNNNDIIYIDTCSLMQNANTEAVIEAIRPYLLAANKKILITAPVSHELTKHKIRKKEQTVHLAEKAYEIIEKYDDVFTLEECGTTKKEIFAAFADKTLLAHLLLNKDNCSQLLITNDKKLSADALNINDLKSCRGEKVTVYYVSENGELEVFVPTKAEEPQTERVAVPETPKHNVSKLEKALDTICVLSCGLLIGKYGSDALKYLKHVNWRRILV
jgi:rRNA-processing protein FCF1